MNTDSDKIETHFFIATFPMQTVIIEVEANSKKEAEKKAQLSSLVSGAEFRGSASEYLGLSNV